MIERIVANVSGQLDIFRHHCLTRSVDRSQVGVLQNAHHVGFQKHLKLIQSHFIETKVCCKVTHTILHEPDKGCLCEIHTV